MWQSCPPSSDEILSSLRKQFGKLSEDYKELRRLNNNIIKSLKLCCDHFTVCCDQFIVCCDHFTVCCDQFTVWCDHFTVCCNHFTVCCDQCTVRCDQFTICCDYFTVCCDHFTVCCDRFTEYPYKKKSHKAHDPLEACTKIDCPHTAPPATIFLL